MLAMVIASTLLFCGILVLAAVTATVGPKVLPVHSVPTVIEVLDGVGIPLALAMTPASPSTTADNPEPATPADAGGTTSDSSGGTV